MDRGLPQLHGICTLTAAAREAGVCYASLRTWVKSGKLDAWKLPGGRDYLVRQEDVDWLGAQSRRYYDGQRRGGKVSAARRAAERESAVNA